jgi:hypothetical protein
MNYLIAIEGVVQSDLYNHALEARNSIADRLQEKLNDYDTFTLADYAIFEVELAGVNYNNENHSIIMRDPSGRYLLSEEYDSYDDFGRAAYDYFNSLDNLTVYEVINKFEATVTAITVGFK